MSDPQGTGPPYNDFLFILLLLLLSDSVFGVWGSVFDILNGAFSFWNIVFRRWVLVGEFGILDVVKLHGILDGVFLVLGLVHLVSF